MQELEKQSQTFILWVVRSKTWHGIIGIEAHEMSPHTVFNVKMFTLFASNPFRLLSEKCKYNYVITFGIHSRRFFFTITSLFFTLVLHSRQARNQGG